MGILRLQSGLRHSPHPCPQMFCSLGSPPGCGQWSLPAPASHGPMVPSSATGSASLHCGSAPTAALLHLWQEGFWVGFSPTVPQLSSRAPSWPSAALGPECQIRDSHLQRPCGTRASAHRQGLRSSAQGSAGPHWRTLSRGEFPHLCTSLRGMGNGQEVAQRLQKHGEQLGVHKLRPSPRSVPRVWSV